MRRRLSGLYAPELLESRIAPATFIVNSLLDDGTDGTLRKEIADANLRLGADTIVFDKALTGTILLTGTEIAIKDTLTIKGPGIDILTISGNDARRIFKIDDLDVDPLVLHPVSISGLTFIDGRATTGSANGGAIESLEPLTLKNVAVVSSFSGNHGGGVSVVTAGKVSITDCRITGNESNVAGNKHGGGLFIQAAGGISIVKTTFANNKSTIGGGLYAQATGTKATMVIDRCVFTSNSASGRGGGLFVDGTTGGKIVVKNSLISGNTGGGGGGLYHDAGNLVVSKTTFSGNTGSRGGALTSEFSADATLVVTGSRFLGNHSTGSGGAMYLGIGPTVKISSSLFAGNTAGTRGGAITVSGIDTRLDVTGSSFLGNSAALNGGAFFVRERAELHIKSSVISGNHADGAGPDGNGGAIWTTSGTLEITGSKFTENKAANFGGAIMTSGIGAFATNLGLSGNLFQGNASQVDGGVVYAKDASVFASKGDKFIGNVAIAGQGGAVHLTNTGAITATGSLFQGNVSAGSGGAVILHGSATFTGVKVLDNITGSLGRGGGLRISGDAPTKVVISKSIITGNVASEGGGIYKNGTGDLELDAATIVRGNAAALGPSIIRNTALSSPGLVVPPTRSATIIVDSLLDNGDGAKTTLREAIAMANDQATHPGPDTIAFKIPIANLPGKIVLNGSQLLITEALTIKGPGIDLLTVSGNDASRIFQINYTTASLQPTTISGLTLTNGKSAAANGGAVYSFEPLTLKNVVIRSSYAAGTGGGVSVNTDGKVSIVGSRIVNNTAGIPGPAGPGAGGGLYLWADAGVSVVKTTIANNSSVKGGGLYAKALDAKSVILIDTCNIANNSNTTGLAGGVALNGAADGKIIVKNSLITGNKATTAGGGISLNAGNLAITKTAFSNNTAKHGGALADHAATSLTIDGSRFLNNTASDAAGAGGGALYVKTPSVVKIADTLFVGNRSARDGGAISDGGTVPAIRPMTITGSSFLANTAVREGGAIDLGFGVALTMKGSILSGNVAATKGGAISLAEAGTSMSVNLTGNKFTENKANLGGAIYLNGLAGDQVTANLSGNLFQANVSEATGGAVFAKGFSIFTSKADKFIGNVALTGQGGGVYLINTGGTLITGSLVQGNVAGSSGGGMVISGLATLTSVKVLDNIAGTVGRGGGIRISGGVAEIFKSVISGNVASEGGGIFYNVGTTLLDPTTKVTGNAARTGPNLDKL